MGGTDGFQVVDVDDVAQLTGTKDIHETRIEGRISQHWNGVFSNEGPLRSEDGP